MKEESCLQRFTCFLDRPGYTKKHGLGTVLLQWVLYRGKVQAQLFKACIYINSPCVLDLAKLPG